MKKLLSYTLKASILLFLLLGFGSCSKENEDLNSADLIQRYGLAGAYTFQVTPLAMGLSPVTSGTINGLITHEGNGVLRLVYSGFQEAPMPFAMSVDIQFTVRESPKGLSVEHVPGKGYFNADKPDNGIPIDDIWELPPDAVKEGVHSNGKSITTGDILNLGKEKQQFDLKLDPAVNLPVAISIRTLKKIH